MKKLIATAFLALLLGGTPGTQAGNHHGAHAKHGMFLYGDETLFASHIVYKSPHNYQVILKILLHKEAREAYEQTKGSFPDQALIFVLDTMDLSTIVSKPTLHGTLFREDSQGQRIEVLSGIEVAEKNYDVIFFSELPLSLESQAHAAHGRVQ